jgi:hypothetical protein
MLEQTSNPSGCPKREGGEEGEKNFSENKLLIVGDINIHTDLWSNSTAIKFQSILHLSGLFQHVNGPTHMDGHSLELVIYRKADNVVTDCSVSDLICDHFAVHTFVKAYRPPRPRKKITYRELHNINEENFLSDMFALPLFTAKAPDIGDRLIQYNDGLSSLLESPCTFVDQNASDLLTPG